MLLYSKILKMPSKALISKELGKITNLLANDLGVMERLYAITYSLVFPILLIGKTIVLAWQMGWAGVLGVAFVNLIIPISLLIAKINGETIKKASELKDKRM